ncbi:MAG TPA: hypothetical protein VFT74_11080 [Isosphaeraceae bacterium]|nr:hypothetical protein [Isosphaeraceae bacterium]
MRRFRLRSLMAAIAVVAVLVWGSLMGWRSCNYYQLANFYGSQEYGWRRTATRGHFPPDFYAQCVEYFAQLTRKYRRAMWHPWERVAPDPHAPGFDQWQEQEERLAKELASAPHAPRLPPPQDP